MVQNQNKPPAGRALLQGAERAQQGLAEWDAIKTAHSGDKRPLYPEGMDEIYSECLSTVKPREEFVNSMYA